MLQSMCERTLMQITNPLFARSRRMTNYQSLRPKGIKSALSLTYYESARWPRTALRTAAISSEAGRKAARSSTPIMRIWSHGTGGIVTGSVHTGRRRPLSMCTVRNGEPYDR